MCEIIIKKKKKSYYYYEYLNKKSIINIKYLRRLDNLWLVVIITNKGRGFLLSYIITNKFIDL